MRRHTAFGLLGILTLSAAFVGFVISCHTGTEDTHLSAYMHTTEPIYLPIPDSIYDLRRDSYTLVVTLRPRTAWYGASIDWYSDRPDIVFVKYDTMRPLSGGFGENGRATVAIVGYNVGEARITATVTREDGTPVNIVPSSYVVVRVERP